MRNFSVTTIAALAVLSWSSPSYATHKCEDYGLKPVGLFVAGQPVEEFVARTRETPGGVDEFIQSLGITELTEGSLTELLQRIYIDPTLSQYEGFTVPDALKGIGGFATTTLLQHLLFVDGQSIAKKVFYGRIRDYIFIKETGSGHLSVDTCTDDRQNGKREFYHWDIEVPSGEFNVTLRGSDPLDPFPGMQLPEASLDPANPHGIWMRDLNHKLGAKGDQIKIHHVYYRNLDMTAPLKRFESTHDYYESTVDSCVDLLTHGDPPATFSQLVGNDYCLGRCGHPAIYNSGD